MRLTQVRKFKIKDVKKSLFKISILLFSAFIPIQSALAFKVETHVWVGQQVINDLSDGALTFKLGRKKIKIRVDSAIANAIKQFPDAYRMGNIGPDASPGILTGQMVVHPGNADKKGNWETDDWLRWILQGASTPEEKAYAYGYLGHASADVFSHTYVNQVSGDVFSLFDGEQEVEARHITLEKYIAARTPALSNAGGSFVGQPYNVIKVPTNFIFNRLIMNPTVQSQYKIAGMGHLTGIYKLRNNIQSTIDGPINKIENAFLSYMADQVIGKAANLLDIPKLKDLENKIRAALVDNKVTAALIDLNNQYVALINKSLKSGSKVAIKVSNATIDLITLGGQLDKSIRDLAAAQSKLLGTAHKILKNTCNQVCHNILVPSCIFGMCIYIPKKVCNTVCNNLWVINPTWAAQDIIVKNLLKLKASLTKRVNDTKAIIASGITAATNAEIALRNAQNDAINAAIALAQRYAKSSNPVRAMLEGWIVDINNGTHAYIVANQNSIKNSMKPGSKILQPLTNWVDCWGLSMTAALPAPVANTYCKTKNSALSIYAEISKLEADIVKLVGNLNPIQKLIFQLKQKLLAEVEKVGKDLAFAIVSKVTGIDIKEIEKLLKSPADAASLNLLFANSRTSKNLLLVDRMAERVDAEMKLNAAGKFNPKRYNVAYNAVVLAKLSLLTEAQLNRLAARAGVRGATTYGAKLYSATTTGPTSLLINAVRSLDGNHQWMEKAPPYPRRVGAPLDSILRTFGYSKANGKGFRFWQDAKARKLVFNKLFKGPLAPAIEKPKGLRRSNFVEVLDSRYQYRACKRTPFPDLLALVAGVLPINDKRCLKSRR